jgi:hypothetical protein
MPQTPRLSALCGQEIGISGHDVAVGRESGGADAGHELVEEVSHSNIEDMRRTCILTPALAT